MINKRFFLSLHMAYLSFTLLYISIILEFLENPQLSTGVRFLYQLLLELGQSCHFPQRDELAKVSFGHKSQNLSLTIVIRALDLVVFFSIRC